MNNNSFIGSMIDRVNTLEEVTKNEHQATKEFLRDYLNISQEPLSLFGYEKKDTDIRFHIRLKDALFGIQLGKENFVTINKYDAYRLVFEKKDNMSFYSYSSPEEALAFLKTFLMVFGKSPLAETINHLQNILHDPNYNQNSVAEKKSCGLKFKVVEAGTLPSGTKVIARTDGRSMTGDSYFVVNADEPFAADVLALITNKYGYIGEIKNEADQKPKIVYVGFHTHPKGESK